MVGDRQMRRLVKIEQEKLKQQMRISTGVTRNENSVERVEEVGIAMEVDDSNTGLDNIIVEEVNHLHSQEMLDREMADVGSDLDLNAEFKKWYLKHKPTRYCAIELITLFNKHNLKIKPFYKFKGSNKPDIMQINMSSYLHIGLTKQLNKIDVLKDIPDFLALM